MASRSAYAVGFGVGSLVATVLFAVGADAQEPPAAPVEERSAQKCRLFAIADMTKDRDLATDDKSTEVGQWMAEREAQGWRLVGVDFEIAQKSTGYPQGWQQVCVEKRP